MALNRKTIFPIAVPLRAILTIPYILLIVLSISIVGYISFQNGEASVNNVAMRLRNETALRVEQHLTTFLDIPHQINQFNAYAIQSGELNLADTVAMQKHFLEQVKLHPFITSVYFGNTEGGLVGGGREGTGGSLYITDTENNRSGDFHKFGVDEMGNVNREPPATVPNFDARTRPWYVSAFKKRDATWSDIYVLFTGQDMAIAASQPVYDEDNNLLGVVSVDIFLSQLSKYLETLNISPIGQVFIMERSGALVATSTGEILFEDINNDGIKERLYARDSLSAVIRQSDSLLIQKYGDYQNIPVEEQQLEFTLDGEKQFLQFLSVRDSYGIDWIVAAVIPESAFMGEIKAGNRTTIWLIFVALAGTIATSIFISLKITKRISQLDKSAQALAAGEWNMELDAGTRIAELNELAISFKQMKEQLRNTLDSLQAEVAERKRMEEALRKSESLLAEAQRVGHFGHAEWMANRNEVTCSDEMLLIFGLPPGDHVISRSAFGSLIHADDRQYLAAMDRKYFAEHSDLDYEYRIIIEGNKVRWIHQHAKITFDENGMPFRMIGVFHDITERKLAEQKLQESEKRFRNLVETTSDWIWETDANGVYTYASPRTHNILGLDPSEVIGKTPFNLMPAEEAQRVLDTFSPVFAARIQFSDLENKNLHKDGHIVILETSGVPIFDHNGVFCGYRGIDRDITERKRMEREIQSQRDFATQIINMMGQGLTVTDSNGRFEFVNPAYARLFGYEPADLIGKEPKDVTMLEDIIALTKQKEQRRDGKTTTYESRLRRADGSIAHVLITGVPRGHEEHYKGSIAVITDLTEQKHIEEELRQAKNLLELSNLKLEQSLLREQELSRIDDLTGVNNRRHLFELAEREFAIASRYEHPLAVILFDIDHFKKINDTYGHAMGDQVLKQITQIARSELRKADVIGRYGGEEFIILSPMTNARQAYLLAERIRKKTEALRMRTSDEDIFVTLSSGVVEITLSSNYKTVEDAFQRADQAMYNAKQTGRNRTVILDR